MSETAFVRSQVNSAGKKLFDNDLFKGLQQKEKLLTVPSQAEQHTSTSINFNGLR